MVWQMHVGAVSEMVAQRNLRCVFFAQAFCSQKSFREVTLKCLVTLKYVKLP